MELDIVLDEKGVEYLKDGIQGKNVFTIDLFWYTKTIQGFFTLGYAGFPHFLKLEIVLEASKTHPRRYHTQTVTIVPKKDVLATLLGEHVVVNPVDGTRIKLNIRIKESVEVDLGDLTKP